MYLSFIIDIVNKGTLIKVICSSEEFVGSVIKITEELLAIRLKSDSSIKIIKDEEISDVKIINEDESSDAGKIHQEIAQEPTIRLVQVLKEFNIGMDTVSVFLQKNGYADTQITPTTKITEDMYSLFLKEFGKGKELKAKADEVAQQIAQIPHFDETVKETENLAPEETTTSEDSDVTIDADVDYDSSIFDQALLLEFVKNVECRLSPTDRKLIFEANAYVISTTKHSFAISTLDHPKQVVLSRSIIECSLQQDLSSFNVGDTLPIVAYKHETILPDKVTLVLSPNSILGVLKILNASVEEKHYASTKLLCYFLLSHINSVSSRLSLFGIIRALKAINPFVAANQKITTDSSRPGKISKNNKFIEKTINEYINSIK